MTFRRPAGIFQTAESAGHDISRLDCRYDEAEAIEPAWEIFLSEREAHCCRGCVRDLLQSIGGITGNAAKDSCGLGRRSCENYGVHFKAFVAAGRNLPEVLVRIPAKSC